MKQLIGIMIVGLVLVAAIGCEGEDPPDDAGRVYVKRPPNPADVPVDGRLMEDQRKLSQKYEDADAGTAAPIKPAAPKAGTGDAVEEVKALLPELLAASKAADLDTLAKYLEPDVMSDMRAAASLMDDLDPKIKSLDRLIRDKLQVEPPANIKEMASESPEFNELLFPTGADFQVADMEYKVVGGTVEVYAPKKGPGPGQTPKKRKPQLVFAISDGAWRLQLDPLQKEFLAVVPDLGPAMNKAIEAMTNGVNSGEITADNLEAKFKELSQKHMGPVIVRLMPLMMRMMAEGMAEGANDGSGGGDSGGAPAPPPDSSDSSTTQPAPPDSGGDDSKPDPTDKRPPKKPVNDGRDRSKPYTPPSGRPRPS